MTYDRVLLLVLDGCGAGVAPDAADFGDDPAHPGDTLVHVAQAVGGLKIPELRRLGLGNMLRLDGGQPVAQPAGTFARLREKSRGGKDTVTGHWEMMGIIAEEKFPTYPDGFPEDLLAQFSAKIGRSVIGNRASSGTVILEELGEEHLRTGSVIVYTSADSVFQIATNEAIVPIEELYQICLAARAILQGQHAVQRVIARPFEGSDSASFRRTERRKDFPLSPPENVLDQLQEAGIFTAGIGVIPEVFDNRGFNHGFRTQNNLEHYQATLELLKKHPRGFFFINFEDFDMLYGHRLDPQGFGAALETFDGYLREILKATTERDLVIITADHGNDPCVPSTDHTREYAPLLMFSKGLQVGRNLGDRPTFADIGATVLDAFGVRAENPGQSLLAL